ncbi:MAG: SusC/RagA family TonB-linked outer membrane protein [Bacteroides sp.]|uniref:SusC/RagA family TonB-linked outer membrane protein n=2 Tax=Bacteroides sp. TaxID=29523 RepID=UPI002FCB3741
MKKKYSFIARKYKCSLNLKLPLAMKISFIMLFFVAFQLQAATGYAQKTNTPIRLSNVTVESVLNQIEKKSGYVFLYNSKTINNNRIVSIENKSDIPEMLREIFSGTNVKYTIVDNQIILSQGKLDVAQDNGFQLKGVVKDSKGESLIGVTVQIEGTTNGTVTGLDGDFSLKVQKGNTVIVSYIGYTTQKIKIEDSKQLAITMVEDAEVLDEVVVTALGIKRKSKALGYNVQEVKSSEVTAVKDANFVKSLTGKVAGLQINSSASGIGGATKVVMRGSKSISKSNNVLYVIDGVPMSNSQGGVSEGLFSGLTSGEGISDINPEDIESMSILTGPSAAALYGSNAANGAILITTKQGTEGEAKIVFAHNTDFMKPFVTPRFQNTYGNKKGEFASWGDKLETPSSYDPIDFFRTGYSTTTSLSISTGTKKNQTFASASVTNSGGIIPNNEYNRYNFTIKNTSSFFKDKVNLDLGFSYIAQEDQNMLAQGQYYNPLLSVYLFPRGESFDNVRLYERYDEGRKIMTQYWPYGNQGKAMQNPYWIANRNVFTNNRDRYMANVGLRYKVTEWLNVSGRLRLDNTLLQHDRHLYASTDPLHARSKGYMLTFKDQSSDKYADLIANVNKRFELFDLTANIGTSIHDTKSDRSGTCGHLLKSPNFFALKNIDLYGSGAALLQEGDQRQAQSIFASAEVGYKSMIYVSATARNDWDSSLMGTTTKSFFYPSVGVSAVLTEMMKMPDWVTFLKLRGSYSSVGNAPTPYLAHPTYAYTGQGQISTNTHYPIKDLKPERTKSYEFGVNLKMFDGRLGLDATYYRSNTYDQIFKSTLSPSSGYSSFYLQAGNVENWGIETMLSFNDTFGKLSWNSNLTFSMNRNKIIELVRNYPDPITGEPLTINSLEMSKTGSYSMILKEGGSIGDLYTSNKLREDNQGFIYVDPNTNTLQTVDCIQKVGSANPDFNLGFRNSFSYRNFNLGFLFNARIGGEVISATQAIMDAYGVSEESAIARDNGGVLVNYGKLDTQYYYEYIGSGETGMLSNYVYSATNIRLQELTFGYMMPKSWFNDYFSLNVSFVGRNLWMIYNKAPFDPEVIASTGNYYQGIDYFMQPSLRNIGFSLRVEF